MKTEEIVNMSISNIIITDLAIRVTFNRANLIGLSSNISQMGVIQPIIVRKYQGADNKYELMIGKRRLLAAKAAKLQTIPAIVKNMDDKTAMLFMLSESFFYEEVDHFDRAIVIFKLVKKHKMTVESIADGLRIDAHTVNNELKLLMLCDEVRMLVQKGKLPVTHAYIIANRQRDAAKQIELAQMAMNHALTSNELEKEISKKRTKSYAHHKCLARNLSPLKVALVLEELSSKLDTIEPNISIENCDNRIILALEQIANKAGHILKTIEEREVVAR